MMDEIDMLGYRAACRVPTSMFTVNTMGATGTHDHATIAGILLGTDAEDMLSVGKSIDEEAEKQKTQAIAAEADLPISGPYSQVQVEQAVLARSALVANSASRVVVFNLEDAAAVKERPNMPGTVTQWPNWSWAIPAPSDDVLNGPLAKAIAAEARKTRLTF
jgi:4-alpha-glucanotransferase